MLGERARRFLLSDAQHVVAREAGHRTWPELKQAEDASLSLYLALLELEE